MKFLKRGYTPSEDNSYLKDVYGIPDYVTSVDSTFRVKRGIFTWSVTNLSGFTESKSGSVFCPSPSFRLLDTAWCFEICPKANLDGQRGVSLRLRRDASDSGPEKVLASYRLGLRKSSSSVWFEAKESAFRKNSFYQLDTSVLGYLEDSFDDGVDGASVLCEIYVSYFPGSVDAAWEVSEIDEFLPVDMSSLLSTRRPATDVSIEVRGGKQVRAHRIVLAARSRTLESRWTLGSFVGAPSNEVVLQLSCSLTCLKCALSYMYTGSLDYLARNAYFGVGLYEVADELSLLPLRDLCHPERKAGRSFIHVHSSEEVHVINFNEGRFFSGATFRTLARRPSSNRELRSSVLVYKLDHLPEYCVAFKLETDGMVGCFHAETSLRLLDKHGGGVAARLLVQDLEGSGAKLTAIFVMTAEEFLSRDVESHFIAVSVGHRLYQMRHDHVKSLCSESLWGVLEPWCWREQLAQDMKTLLLQGRRSSDVSLVVERRVFRVHRPILAARSPLFHSLFYGGERKAAYRIKDMKPRTFMLMLHFLYCGTLSHFKTLTLEDFLELHRASITYGLPSLFNITSLFMKMMTGGLDFQ